MSRRQLVFWVTMLGVFAMAARVSMDTDSWWHLRSGAWIVEHRALPRTDPFSYTRQGQPWHYPGWLAQVPMVWIYRGLGPGGLNLWVAGMVALAFYFVWHTLEGGEYMRAFIIVLAAAVSGVYWAARPYMVTFLLAAVFLEMLEKFRWGKFARLWWLPVLMVVWVNSHGGFAVGMILWGVYAVGEGWRWLREGPVILRIARLNNKEREGVMLRREAAAGGRALARAGSDASLMRIARLTKEGGSTAGGREATLESEPGTAAHKFLHLLLIGLLLIVAVSLNPYGPVMLFYPFKTVNIQVLRDFIQEWQTPNFHMLSNQPFIWLLLITFGAVGASRKKLALVDFLLVAGFAYLSLLAGRNIALFALVAPMVLSRHAQEVLGRWGESLGVRIPRRSPRAVSRVQRVGNGIILGLLLLAVGAKVVLVFPFEENQKVFEKSLPLGAVAYLRQHRPEGRLFNSYNWGGYLLWALPEYPVFVDGRTDLYDDEIIREWLRVARGEAGWQSVLDRWGVKVILLERDWPLVRLLPGEGWQLWYEDDLSVVYGRTR